MSVHRFGCKNFGAFGVFLDHAQLTTFINEMSISVSIPVPKYGAKLLFSKEDYEEEWNSITKLPDAVKTYIHGESHTITNINPENTCIFENEDGHTNKVVFDELYFIFQKVLSPIPNFKNETSANVFKQFVQPLLTQVEALHSNDMYHCDIKPANIMMDGDKATLIDFGLMSTLTKPSYGGTPVYMSPAYRKLIGHDHVPPMNMSYHNFFRLRSFYTYHSGEHYNTATLNSYYLAHNDLYALGLSIQRVAQPVIPTKIQDALKTTDITSLSSPLIQESGVLKPMTYAERDFIRKITTNLQPISIIAPLAIAGGGIAKKRKRTVLGRKRLVFKIPGQGNRLFVRIRKTDIPLKAALKFERTLKGPLTTERRAIERFVKSYAKN